MEKFMLLFRGGNFRSLSPQEMQIHMQRWFSWMDSLQTKGILVGSEPLQPIGRQINGKNKTITNGPFIESKEMIGGYTIINATDLDEAVEISKGCPILEMDGNVEVRPIQKVDR